MIDRRLYNATVQLRRGGTVRFDQVAARIDPPSDEQIAADGGQVRYSVILPVYAADGVTQIRVQQNDFLFVLTCPSVPQLANAAGALQVSDARSAPGAVPGIYCRATWKVQT